MVVTPGPAPAPAAPPTSPAEDIQTASPDTIAGGDYDARATAFPALAHRSRAGSRGVAEGTRPDRGRACLGRGTAAKMAQEIGTLPIIRAWPKGSYLGDGKLEAYRASLVQIANAAEEPRASQLMAATTREQGQGYGTPETPIATLITLQDA